MGKKPGFLVMDHLLTGIVIALICLAAWLFYKRWTGRYREPSSKQEQEPEPESETYEPEEVQTAVAEPPASSDE